MIFEMTEKQYQLFLHIMQVMQTFYGNNFSSICKEVGDAYGVNDVDIEKAHMIFTDFKVTAPVPSMQNAAGENLSDCARGSGYRGREQGEPVY